jgi:hypothetical protein
VGRYFALVPASPDDRRRGQRRRKEKFQSNNSSIPPLFLLATGAGPGQSCRHCANRSFLVSAAAYACLGMDSFLVLISRSCCCKSVVWLDYWLERLDVFFFSKRTAVVDSAGYHLCSGRPSCFSYFSNVLGKSYPHKVQTLLQPCSVPIFTKELVGKPEICCLPITCGIIITLVSCW